ncbi:hypothetical protein BDZ97DRAFT_1823158 [Flammula alnicola]|nr:hypothetical protein BDZ97DRAFT_1823158 [Flammula alnicola]
MLGLLQKALLKMCNPTSKIIMAADPDPMPSPIQPATPRPVMESLQTRIQELRIDEKHPCSLNPSNSDPGQPTALPEMTFQLPPEIVAEIFAITCHATSYKFQADTRRHKRTTPLILGSVCREWRELVWSTPHIWSHVPLVLSSSRYDTQTELLRDWLSRSGVCPLVINLLFQEESEWSDRIPMELIQLLISVCHRWRIINFVLPESWYTILDEIKDKFPLLIKVSTQPLWSDCGLSPSKRRRLTLFESAPVLRDLHLNGYYLSDVNVPWKQLTLFTLQHVYLDECFLALSKTPNLKFCRIYTILENDVGRGVQDISIKLLFLEQLIIYSAIWDDTIRLLSHMSLPALHTLEFSSPQDDLVVTSIPALLLGSGCQLQTLKLNELQFNDEEASMIDCLRNIPSLTVLELDLKASSVPVCNFFLDLLKPQLPVDNEKETPIPVYFLPKLKQFTFSGPIVPNKEGFDEAILQVLQLRRNSTTSASDGLTEPLPGRLSSFDVKTEIKYDYPLTPGIEKKFVDLVDGGLRLSIVFDSISWL